MPLLARRLILLALLCAAGVALLALLFYGSDRFNDLDTRATAKLLAAEGSRAESVGDTASDLANGGPLLVLTLILVGLGFYWRRPTHLLAGLAVVVLANVTTQGMKIVLSHPRVQGELGASYPIEIGYPSGHTTAALSVGFALWLIAPPGRRRLAALVAAAYGLLVGAGVVVAGWHYLSDVAGAFMVVGFWAALAMAALVSAGYEPPRQAGSRLRGRAEGPK
jgi:membrane-associated phospholipid phosphatase